VQVNFSAKEVVLKLVYYGPALSGKTSNLKALHDRVDAKARGRLMSLATKDDRTLFFDMLPLAIRGEGMSLRVKVFTVPGQVLHASTRRFVLQGADGVAFIADSRVAETESNAASFRDLRDNLKELGRPIKQVPLVIQFNKRDLPAVRTSEELRELARRGSEPVFTASALTGEGVLESFFGLLSATCERMEQDHILSEKIGLSPSQILEAACTQFGISTPFADLLSARLSGGFSARGVG
jgi:mutual gliding-motility protein MglA